MESWAAQTRSGLRRMEQPFISLSGKAISIIIISQRKGVRGYEMSFSGVLGRKSFNKYHENVSRNKRMFPGASPLLSTSCPPPGLVTAMWDGTPSLASLLCQPPPGEVRSRYTIYTVSRYYLDSGELSWSGKLYLTRCCSVVILISTCSGNGERSSPILHDWLLMWTGK